MIRALMHGASGAMGHVITDMAESNNKLDVIAGVDINSYSGYKYPIFSHLDEVDVEYDVIIDFCTAKAVDELLEYAVMKRKPIVLCTTGLSDEQLDKVKNASKQIAILRSGNMSLGINLMEHLVEEATKVLYKAGFDIEVVEMHHHRKLDAPSGTAIMLADSASKASGENMQYVYDRHDIHEARKHQQIGISSVRGGSIVGEHDVIFAGEDEVITLKHEAYSRKIFAAGAISAAVYLYNKAAGLYSMSDVIEN